MIRAILDAPFRLPALAHAAAAAAAFAAFQAVKARLDASYAASGHPVDYATGQTAFSGAQVKQWYGAMQAQGTLDVYVSTQLIDFGFIASIAALALLLGAGVGRLGRDRARRLGRWTAAAGLAGAACDAAENLVSFVMLADPQGFADWIAIPYSGFAAAKFALLTAAMAGLLITLLTAGWEQARRRPAAA